MAELSAGEILKIKRRYRICYMSCYLGLEGYDLPMLKALYLTTWSQALVIKGQFRGETRNTWRVMKGDLKKCIFQVRKPYKKDGAMYPGFRVEYWFSPELTPKLKLLHLHGFLRVYGEFDSGELNRRIHELWARIHDSPICRLDDMYSMKVLIKYDMKDAIKNYIGSERFGGRILKSRNWMRKGWKPVLKEIYQWYVEKRYPSWMVDGEVVLDDAGNDISSQFVYMAKEMKEDFIKRWCNGERIKLDFRDRVVYIDGEQVYEREKENLDDSGCYTENESSGRGDTDV